MTAKERQQAGDLAEALGLPPHTDLPLGILVSVARHQLESAAADHRLDRAAIAFAHARCDQALRRQHVRRRRCVPNPRGVAS